MPTPALPAWHQHRRLADLHDTGVYAHCAEPLELARKWVAKFRSDEPLRKGLFLWGPVGSGKTTIAASIALELSCPYWDVRAFYARLKEGFAHHGDRTLEDAVRARVLVLDDIAKQRSTEWARETIRDLVERRYDRGGLLVCTSNFSPQQMAAFLGDAAWSRLGSSTVPIHVNGPDLRKLAA